MPVRLKTPLSKKWEVVLSLGMVLPPMGRELVGVTESS